MSEREKVVARALQRELDLPVSVRFGPGSNQEQDHVVISDEQGGEWRLSLFSRADADGLHIQLRETIAALGRCRLTLRDHRGAPCTLAFEIAETLAPSLAGAPVTLILRARTRQPSPGDASR
ncbi:hypothetical protein OG2516_16144 [Oceanicola granulosus HTCC2516]|uniref:Uncharacterized protein n=1 Tax=Oceanicola granulosus (strain ATCC BAA-861 / DSM 15982 / KCTC 12143 / HTCC2516) TaxID=314256 RepID=Q2CGT7_OCEGH|nr:hypothetical protein [Oceanicola granulosus]EAR51848.1 hypothetical protein OG2516_16144 [Oceanicola granulosus HTCC2516]